jgi:error-prone DNA polymerase
VSDVYPAYAELHCLSNFSFLRGASTAEELVMHAAQLGYTALAITDECSFAGVVRAHVAAKARAFKLILGAEFRLPDECKLVLLATDREGYGNLSQLITSARQRSEKGCYRVEWNDFEQGVPGCLVIIFPPESGVTADPPALLEQLSRLGTAFPDSAWIGVELLCGWDDRARLEALQWLAQTSGLPLVAAGNVHMHVRSRQPLQDALTAIRLRTTVAAARGALYPNGERHLRARAQLEKLYPCELLAETVRITARCNFTLDCLRYEYPEELVPPPHTPASYLRTLVAMGFLWRFGEHFTADDGAAPLYTTANLPRDSSQHRRNLQEVRALIEHELALIGELGYEPYFLTVHDIVRFARSRDILCQGRGSAANSTVCYCLGITEVDPVQMHMLFERFISRDRGEPPDIDVDFEHQRREEVIQYLYDKYGRDRAAITATVITYGRRSALRDVGKALGLEPQQIERLTRSLAWWDDNAALPQRLAEAGFAPDSPQIARLIALVNMLSGFPRHLSQHTGGFVISRGPLSRLVPIENAAMPGRSVIEWNKDDLESLGLLKVDVLALGMLSAIKRALDLIGQRHGRPFTMMDIPREDPAVYAMIQRADTVGVFQIESRAQMSMLPRLRPGKFYDLVIEVAIVRPGPIQGGMVHPYLRRRQGLEKIDYPSKAVKAVLERTLGVPIFQEQVMELAVVAAGFTPDEADKLRRAMAAWKRKGGLDHFEQKLTAGLLKNNYSREFADRIFRQILGFGEYGFPESHSVSFALLAYISSWLKHYEPAIFLVALLNSRPMGFYAPSQLVQDARRHGVEVRPVDVLTSAWECALEEDTERAPAVRLGLSMVSGLEMNAAQVLIAARAAMPYASIEDLARRTGLGRNDLKLLADAGALEALAGHRRKAHWQVAGMEKITPLLAPVPARESPARLPAPSEGQNILADYASVGLTLGRHPLALLRTRLARMRMSTAAGLSKIASGRSTRVAGIVTGRQRPGTASGVVFVTLEDETGSVNVIVWHDLSRKQRRELLGSQLMGVHGVLERQGEVVHLIAKRLIDYSALLGGLKTSSRDFH